MGPLDLQTEARLIAILAGPIAADYPNLPHARRLQTARHEAAHATVAILTGIPVREAVIDAATKHPGTAGYVQFGTASAAGDAQPVLFGASDQRTVLQVLSSYPGATWRTIRCEYRRLETEAVEAVREHFWLIRQVADELLLRSRMTGSEIATLIDNARAWQRQRAARLTALTRAESAPLAG